MSLRDLIEAARVPKVIKGRISKGELAAAIAAADQRAGAIRSGASRRAALVEVIGAILGEGAAIFEQDLQRRAAEAALRAVEAELELARLEAEGESE